jgi:hypothetical protein
MLARTVAALLNEMPGDSSEALKIFVAAVEADLAKLEHGGIDLGLVDPAKFPPR